MVGSACPKFEDNESGMRGLRILVSAQLGCHR